MAIDAYVGIDVAIRKERRLPIVIAVHRQGALVPLPLKDWSGSLPPIGPGNEGILDEGIAERYAENASSYVKVVARQFGLCIRRVAIDAPGCHCGDGSTRRDAEAELDAAGIRYYATPTKGEFDRIVREAKNYRDSGGDMQRLPNANRLWMRAGFALFDVLRRDWDCIETYPQAIARGLKAATVHKRRRHAYETQLAAASAHTGWPVEANDPVVGRIAFGAPDDRVDAYLSCWVASLESEQRNAFGPRDGRGIWVPRIVENAPSRGAPDR